MTIAFQSTGRIWLQPLWRPSWRLLLLLQQGVAPIQPSEGADLFERLLDDPAAQVSVMDVSWRQWRQLNPRASALPFLSELGFSLLSIVLTR